LRQIVFFFPSFLHILRRRPQHHIVSSHLFASINTPIQTASTFASIVAMPHSPEETRDVQFSGVQRVKEGKIATGSGTTADPSATNATSHDKPHVVANGFHATNATSNITNTSSNETGRNDSHTPEETRSSNRHPTSPWKSVTPSKAPILNTPELTPNARENGEGSRRSSRHYTTSTPQPPSSLGTPAPDRRRHHDTPKTTTDSIKVDKEVAQLKEQLADASPKALQKVLRDNWREFLFEGAGLHHLTFIIRALLKNAPLEVLDRVGEELVFKGGLFEAATHDTKVIDTVIRNADAGNLLASLSTATIDAVVSDRLKTVPAKTLIRWMAENDRLGYQLDDIIEEGESVSPNVTIPTDDDDDVMMTDGVQNQATQAPAPAQVYAQAPPPPQAAPQGPQPPPNHFNGFPPGTHSMNGHPPAAWSNNPIEAARERERHAESLRLQSLEYMQMQQGPASPSIERMQCPSCHYYFFDVAGFNYHVNKKICHKEPNGYKFSCTRCYQGFSTKQGQEYHCKKEVCASNDTPPFRESPSGQLQREATASTLSSTQPPTQGYSAPGPAPASTAPTSTIPAPVLNSHSSPYPQPIPRPPFSTPTSSRREPPSDIRQSPSELPPEKLAALNQELADEDARHARAVAQAATLDPTERANKLVSLKNGTASKKSQIRKKYGVSLRLRDKDKQARLAATTATPPPPTQRMNSNYISSPLPTRVSSAAVPPTTGFSPINAGQRNGPSPNGTPGGSPLPPASYPAPQRPPLAPSTAPLRHAQADRNSDSGFGMLVSSHPRYAPQNQMTTSTYAEQQRNGKRRRSEDDNDGRQSRRASPYFAAANTLPRAPSQRPSLSMMEVSAEDAASKYPRKPLAPGQARNYTPSSRSPVENAPPSTAPPRTSLPASRDQGTPMVERPAEPVYISSEGEGDSAAASHPRLASSHEVLPSIEGTGAETAQPASADAGSSTRQTEGPSQPAGRGETTEDEEPKRAPPALEPAEDPEYKAEKAAAQARAREEALKKESKQ
jgi:hypothetical protein